MNAKEAIQYCARLADELSEHHIGEAQEKTGADRFRAFGKADGCLLVAEAIRTFGAAMVEKDTPHRLALRPCEPGDDPTAPRADAMSPRTILTLANGKRDA